MRMIETAVRRQNSAPRFTEGQRVKICLPPGHVHAQLRPGASIGYVIDSEVYGFAASGSRCYKVVVPKDRCALCVEEEYLESAEHSPSVL